ncbi:hypothetical protein [Gordonia sp. FQ]|uniref:hypothetical protein n=1 Tax=Gordonia sp. FQ TaxID=3446634 RepID=UPI003F84CD5D
MTEPSNQPPHGGGTPPNPYDHPAGRPAAPDRYAPTQFQTPPSYGQAPPYPQQSPPYAPQYPQAQSQYTQPQYAQPYTPAPYGRPLSGAPAAPATLSPAVTIISWVTVGLCVLVAVAAFLPWVTLGALSVSGLDDGRDGTITLGLAVIVGILAVISGVIRKPSGVHLASGIVATLGGLLVAAVGVVDIVDITGDGLVGVGIGLTLTLIFGLALLGAGIAGIVKRR